MEYIIPLKFAGRIGLVPVCIGDGGDHYTVIGRSRVGQFFLAVQNTAVCAVNWAARTLGLSYRHVWGELKRWEAALGHPLVQGAQGRSAQLSEFGDKLLWAERQAQARLAPQVESLHAELERWLAA